MKYLMFLFLFNGICLAQKKPTDFVNFKNFDVVFAEKLLREKFNTEVPKLIKNGKPLKLDTILNKPLEYQLNLFKYTGTKLTHTNDKTFKGIFLKDARDRVEYFNPKIKFARIVEVFTYIKESYTEKDSVAKDYYVIDSISLKNFNYLKFIKSEKKEDGRTYWTYNKLNNTYHHLDDSQVTYNNSITYESIVTALYNNLMINSEAHRHFIIHAYELGLNSFWKIEFKNSSTTFEVWCGGLFYSSTF